MENCERFFELKIICIYIFLNIYEYRYILFFIGLIFVVVYKWLERVFYLLENLKKELCGVKKFLILKSNYNLLINYYYFGNVYKNRILIYIY